MINRRKFIVGGALTAVSLSVFGKVLKSEDGTYRGDCATTSDILGPFYRKNAPIRESLIHEGIVGVPITIKGRVHSDCENTLKNATVEIWHCNTKGEYDNKSNKFLYRARAITSSDGEYTFKTILPGKYLNGKQYRPAHIHFKITAKKHKDLVSQIYFQGDPYIAKDPWASSDKAVERILPISPNSIDGGLQVDFNIYLKKK